MFRHVTSYRIIKHSMPLIMALRKRHFAFLFLVNPVICVSADMSTKVGDVQIHANGLLLYHNLYSFYSQKVVMALHEKKLNFESHFIDISGEQYKPWFLQINPRGEVPVLQDTGKIIPDSNRIIDYLEDNFSNGDTPRLIPMDQGPEVRQKVTHFRNIIDLIPANDITVGSFIHPEVARNPKLPFIAPVRKVLTKSFEESSKNLRKYAESTPEAKEMLLQKADAQEKKYQLIINKEEFLTMLSQVDLTLNKVEEELNSHINDKAEWWLCSDRFTVADLSLAILLERLYELGLESRFWTEGKRPNIEKYFSRIQERDSYKQTIPNTFAFIKMMFSSPIVIGVSVATVLALIIGGFFIVKKLVV